MARLPEHHLGLRRAGRGNRRCGSLVKFAANRRASSRVSRFGRRAMRRINMSGIEGRSESARLTLETTLMVEILCRRGGQGDTVSV